MSRFAMVIVLVGVNVLALVTIFFECAVEFGSFGLGFGEGCIIYRGPDGFESDSYLVLNPGLETWPIVGRAAGFTWFKLLWPTLAINFIAIGSYLLMTRIRCNKSVNCCDQCGYDLSNLSANRCPECGHSTCTEPCD